MRQKVIFEVLLRSFRAVGAAWLGMFQVTGSVLFFALDGLRYTLTPPWRMRVIGRHFIDIGFYTLPVVGLTAIFSGMVLALQSYSGFSRFSAESAVASVVALSVTRELAPVLGGLMVAGRVGASVAAEIGAMRVTEQIDALETLSVSPMHYLTAPRLIAATLMLPILVAIADVIGILGGYIIGVGKLGFDSASYLQSSIDFLEPIDVISGLVKASAFGFIVALMGCYHGFNSGGGAQGVGRAVTNAVVSASVLILISNYLITELFFSR